MEDVDRAYIIPWGRRAVLAAAAGSLLLAALLAALARWQSPWWLAAVVPVAAMGAILVLFYRNPRRRVPAGAGLVVAPADGTVRDVVVVDEPEYVGGPCLRVGIFLSIFDVHLNRAPCTGRVEWLRYRPGKFRDARSPEAPGENEANSIGLLHLREDGSAVRLLVRQISGAIARRIVCPLRVGEEVRRGGLVGMIRYGSRTELWIPEASRFRLEVSVGERVRAGETVLGRFVAAEVPGVGAE